MEYVARAKRVTFVLRGYVQRKPNQIRDGVFNSAPQIRIKQLLKRQRLPVRDAFQFEGPRVLPVLIGQCPIPHTRSKSLMDGHPIGTRISGRPQKRG